MPAAATPPLGPFMGGMSVSAESSGKAKRPSGSRTAGNSLSTPLFTEKRQKRVVIVEHHCCVDTAHARSAGICCSDWRGALLKASWHFSFRLR